MSKVFSFAKHRNTEEIAGTAPQRQAQKDMTSGSPAKIIWSFSVPVMLGNMFQQVYSMTDTIIVGRFIGTKALAAVGSTGTITFLILGFMWGLAAGFTVPLGQRFGAGDLQGVKRAAGNAASLGVLFSVGITAISMLMMRRLLTLMHTPDDIFDMAYSYIMIIIAGYAAQMLYTMLSSMLRALGNSRAPLVFLIVSASLNILLDLLLIIVIPMGVAGAAWATVISQGLAGLACLVYVLHSVPALHFTVQDLRLGGWATVNELRIGVPMALQFSITAVGALMLQSSLNLLGSTAVAAFTAGGKISNLLSQIYTGIGVTMAAYCAQNTGAGKMDRVRDGVKAARIQGYSCAVAAGIAACTVGKYFTYLFISDGIDEIIGMVDVYMKCCGFFMVFLVAIFIYRNSLQGIGYSLFPMLAGVVELFARGITAWIGGLRRSFVLICLSDSFAWVAAAIFLSAGYYVLMRRREKQGAARLNARGM